ncbi:hypothetical protein NL676_033092 [Syzygium grande]|nr:hypothetical protein NL676_033092 [Syzygium grande]
MSPASPPSLKAFNMRNKIHPRHVDVLLHHRRVFSDHHVWGRVMITEEAVPEEMRRPDRHEECLAEADDQLVAAVLSENEEPSLLSVHTDKSHWT